MLLVKANLGFFDKTDPAAFFRMPARDVIDNVFFAITDHDGERGNPGIEEAIDLVIQNGLVAKPQQTFGQSFGHLTNAGAKPRGQNHGFHGSPSFLYV
jgi:hypothetical protein